MVICSLRDECKTWKENCMHYNPHPFSSADCHKGFCSFISEDCECIDNFIDEMKKAIKEK